MITNAQLFHSSEMASLSNLGGETINNVQFDPQATEMWPTELIVTMSALE